MSRAIRHGLPLSSCGQLDDDFPRLETVSVWDGMQRYAEWILSKPKPAEYFFQGEQTLKGLRIVRTLKVSAHGPHFAGLALSAHSVGGRT